MAMGKTVRARYKGNNLVELLEPVELEEGKEVGVTIIDFGGPTDEEASRSAAGGWAGIVDVDAFLKHRAEAKRIHRPRPKL
jgi:predicted DNA-binding antitoxin AbrB/MazE fold protein